MPRKKLLAAESLEQRLLLTATHVGWDFDGGPRVLDYTVGEVPAGLVIDASTFEDESFDDDDFRDIVASAFAVWEQEIDVEFNLNPVATDGGVANSIDIRFAEIGNSRYSAWSRFPPQHPVTQGLTCTAIGQWEPDVTCDATNLEQHRLRVAGDIQIDSSDINWEIGGAVVDAFDLKYVLVHEIGHSLGLGHFKDNLHPWVMSSNVSETAHFDELTLADRVAIQHLYAPDDSPLFIDLLTAQIDAGGPAEGFDLNFDNVLDQEDRRVLIENIFGTHAGDANLDGVFNSEDLVLVFIGANYETGAAATWAEGDWNGDGVFNSSDLAEAFATGQFDRT